MTPEKIARRMAELWPEYYSHYKTDIEGIQVDDTPDDLWCSLYPDTISIDALRPVEQELREKGYDFKCGWDAIEKTFYAGHCLTTENDDNEETLHPDEGCARALAAIKVMEETK